MLDIFKLFWLSILILFACGDWIQTFQGVPPNYQQLQFFAIPADLSILREGGGAVFHLKQEHEEANWCSNLHNPIRKDEVFPSFFLWGFVYCSFLILFGGGFCYLQGVHPRRLSLSEQKNLLILPGFLIWVGTGLSYPLCFYPRDEYVYIGLLWWQGYVRWHHNIPHLEYPRVALFLLGLLSLGYSCSSYISWLLGQFIFIITPGTSPHYQSKELVLVNPPFFPFSRFVVLF